MQVHPSNKNNSTNNNDDDSSWSLISTLLPVVDGESGGELFDNFISTNNNAGKRMLSPWEIEASRGRMSEVKRDELVIALEDRLRDSTRQLVKRNGTRATRCISQAHPTSTNSTTAPTPPRLNLSSIRLLTILVLVYSILLPVNPIDSLFATTTTESSSILIKGADRVDYHHHNHHNHHSHGVEPRDSLNGAEFAAVNGKSRAAAAAAGANYIQRWQTNESTSWGQEEEATLRGANIKINRARRSASDGGGTVGNGCSDCLAIPMVALVGRKQVNGFILHPAPASLRSQRERQQRQQQQHGRALANPSSSPSSTSHYASAAVEHARQLQLDAISQQRQHSDASTNGAGDPYNNNINNNNNNNNNNVSRYAEEAPLSGQSYGAGAYEQVLQGHPLSSQQQRRDPGGQYQHPQRQQQQHYRVAAYEQVASASPFEPKSDDKCPMTGPLTVCDQINSYPADAIVHRVAAAKRALHKAYFDIDSLFSDEGDGFSEPFGGNPSNGPMSAGAISGGGGTRAPPEIPETNQADMTDVSNGPGYYQSEVGEDDERRQSAGTKAYHAYDQQASSEPSDQQLVEQQQQQQQAGQEQIEVNNQRAQPAKRERVPSVASQGATAAGAAPVAVSAGRVRHSRRPSRGLSGTISVQTISPAVDGPQGALAGANLNSVSPRQSARLQEEEQPAGGGDFLYLVERRGLSLSDADSGRMTPAEELASAAGTSHAMRTAGNLRDAPSGQIMESAPDVGAGDDGAPTSVQPARLARGSPVKSATHKSGARPRAARGGGVEGALSSNQASAPTTTLRPLILKPESDNDARGAVPVSNAAIRAPANHEPSDRNQHQQQLQQQQQQQHAPGMATISLAQDARADGPMQRSSGGGAATGHRQSRRAKAKLDRADDTQEAALLSAPIPAAAQLHPPPPPASATRRTKLSEDQTITPSVVATGDGRLLSFMSPDHHHPHHHQQLRSSSHRAAAASKSGQFVQQPSRGKHRRPNPERDSATLEPIKLSHSDEQRKANGASAGLARAQLERSKRQVPPSSSSTPPPPPLPIQVDRITVSRAEERDPERAAAAAAADEETPQPQPVCRAKSIYISPKAAMNHKKQWKYVVNAPERDPRIKQIIRVDICEAPFEPCSSDVTLPLGFTSQCKQKYAKKKLLALDARSGLLEVDTFFIPSCCVCQLIPASARFDESPLSPTLSQDEGAAPRDNNNDNDQPPASDAMVPGPPGADETISDDSRRSGRNAAEAPTTANNPGPSDTGNSGDNNNSGPNDNSNEGRR